MNRITTSLNYFSSSYFSGIIFGVCVGFIEYIIIISCIYKVLDTSSSTVFSAIILLMLIALFIIVVPEESIKYLVARSASNRSPALRNTTANTIYTVTWYTHILQTAKTRHNTSTHVPQHI